MPLWKEYSWTLAAAIYLRTAGLEQERVAQFLGPSGKVQEIQLPSSAGSAPRVSPDGSQIAFIVEDKGKSDIWLYELANRRFSRLTFLGGVGAGFGLPAGAAWTPDGKHLLFSSSTPEKGIYWTRADGGGEPQRLVPQISAEVSIAPDEKRFAFVSTADDQKESEILIVPLDLTDPEHPKAGKPKVFLHGSYTIGVPRFSPDGHWIAYTSTESGRSEVYVRQFSPDGSQSGGKWQISTEGERGPPFWSHARKELFYTDPVGRMMVAGYEEKADSFDAGQPRIWSSSPTNLADLMPDGNRFLNVMLGISLQGKNPQVGFLVNFFDELHRRAPESK